jgi:hypothetical protein
MPNAFPGTAPIGGDEKAHAFDKWWNERELSGEDSHHPFLENRPHPLNRPNKLNHPFWAPYKRLYRAGCSLTDLDVIDGIVCCFVDSKVLEKRRQKSFKRSELLSVDPVQIKLEVATRAIADAAVTSPHLFRDEENRREICEKYSEHVARYRPILKPDKEARIASAKRLAGYLRSLKCDESFAALVEFLFTAAILNSHRRGEKADP